MRRLFPTALVVAILLPLSVSAAQFGGSVQAVIPCFNGAIHATVGGPRGGLFLWTPATETYRFGPPSHAGQWVIGLSGIPYVCVVSFLPLITLPGVAMTMVGSSE